MLEAPYPPAHGGTAAILVAFTNSEKRLECGGSPPLLKAKEIQYGAFVAASSARITGSTA